MHLNLRCNPSGSGSLAHVARQLAVALDGAGVATSVENLRPHRAEYPHATAELQAHIHRLTGNPIDPSRTCHVRLAEPQEEERHLISGLFDAAPYGRNVWYWPVDSSVFGGAGAEELTAHLDAVWTPSEHARRSWLAAGLPETFVRVVPHGVDERVFHPDGAVAELPTTRSFRFLTLADPMFWRRKALDTLLRSYMAAFDGTHDVCLVLYLRRRPGCDDVERLLANLRRQHPDPPEVLVEYGPRAEIAPLYRACHCYLQPSRGEAFGLGILEAMACGLPPVVTGWGGQLDFCTGQNSWRVGYRLVPAAPITPDRGLWAEPDGDHLTQVLRDCVHDETDRAAKRTTGLADAGKWSWRHAAAIAAREANRLLGDRRNEL